jgi:hypothetical protein
MGSIPGRVGVVAPEAYTFTAAGQDSGPVGVYPGGGRLPFIRLWPFGWEKFRFQIIGPGTGYAVTVWGTYDILTAEGSGTAWFQLPGRPEDATAAGGTWSNPLLSDNPNNYALEVKAGLRAVRFTSTNALGATAVGSVSVLWTVAG